MEKYVIKSPSFKGTLVMGFREGFLVYFLNDAELNKEQEKWFLVNIPLTVENLKKVAEKMKAQISEIPPDLSFDAFWDAYGKKVNKKRCEPLWEKLTDPEKITCLMSIPAYNSYLKRMGNRAKLDPENYLKREAFQNPWNQLTS